MSNLILTLNENEYKTTYISYRKRAFESFRSLIIFYTLMTFVVSLISSYRNALFILLFLVLLHLTEYLGWAKNQIISIKRTNHNLQINYCAKDELKYIEDHKSSFIFKVKNVWYKVRGRAMFLEIKHNNQVILKQFLLKDIDEKTLFELVKYFSG